MGVLEGPAEHTGHSQLAGGSNTAHCADVLGREREKPGEEAGDSGPDQRDAAVARA